MRSAISLDKVNLVCTETVNKKPTRNDSGFITYLNTIYFSSKWLNNCGYIMNQWQMFVRGYGSYWFKKLVKIEKVINIGKISGKYDILTVKIKQGAHRDK